MQHYKDDPKKMYAKFNSTCSTCGKKISKGDLITYWPRTKKAYHFACSENDWNRFLNSAQDEAMYSGTPFESHDFGDSY